MLSRAARGARSRCGRRLRYSQEEVGAQWLGLAHLASCALARARGPLRAAGLEADRAPLALAALRSQQGSGSRPLVKLARLRRRGSEHKVAVRGRDGRRGTPASCCLLQGQHAPPQRWPARPRSRPGPPGPACPAAAQERPTCCGACAACACAPLPGRPGSSGCTHRWHRPALLQTQFTHTTTFAFASYCAPFERSTGEGSPEHPDLATLRG
jgi:hypothetical protein